MDKIKEGIKEIISKEVGKQSVSSFDKLIIGQKKHENNLKNDFENAFANQSLSPQKSKEGANVVFGSLGTIALTKDIIEESFKNGKTTLNRPLFIILHFSSIPSIFAGLADSLNKISNQQTIILGGQDKKTFTLENKIYLIEPNYSLTFSQDFIRVNKKEVRSTWEPSCDMNMGAISSFFNLSKLKFFVLGGIGNDSLNTSLFLNSRFQNTYLLNDIFCDAATDICDKIKYNIDRYNEINKYELIQLLGRDIK